MKLLASKQAAKLLGLSDRTLKRDRIHGQLGIPYIRLGDGPTSPVRYNEEEVVSWLAGRRFVGQQAIGGAA